MIFIVNLDFIKQRRLEKGYSLQKMVNTLGILDKTKYYRRENGDVSFRPEELLRVANVLEISSEDLFLPSVSEIDTIRWRDTSNKQLI